MKTLFTLFLVGCCHQPQPTLKVITETVRVACIKTHSPKMTPVKTPSVCKEGQPCLDCLPGKICYDVLEANILWVNVDKLQTWATSVDDACSKVAP